MQIALSPRKTLTALLCTIAFLLIANSLGIAWFITYPPVDRAPLWIGLFNVNLEANLPTLFSSLQLAAATVLLAGIGHSHRCRQEAFRFWFALAMIFGFLTIDETAALHENLTVLVRTTLGTSGYLHFAWVIPYGLAGLVIGLACTKFLWRLPRPTMVLFVVSGAIYLTGALGMEMLGGKYISLPGAREVVYAVIYTTEEALEMVGIALFIYALMQYIATEFGQLDYSVQHRA